MQNPPLRLTGIVAMAATLLTPGRAAAQGWVTLPNGEPGYVMNYAFTGHFTCLTTSSIGSCLASGNSIGTNARQSVFATLICESSSPFVEHNTTVSVPLAANGDFRIDDRLDTVPSECPSPVLLIRNTGGVWFAAGLPKHPDN